MSDKNKEAAERAREAARQAERARKRAALQREAAEVRQKINAAENLCSNFQRQQRELEEMINNWNQRKSAAMGSQIVSQVRVSRVFEGVIAEKQAGELPKGIKAMDKNISQLKGIASGVSDQISKLNEYMNTLQNKLSNILARLASI